MELPAALLDSATGTVGMRLAKFGQLLTIGWNLLLIPGALVLWETAAEARARTNATLYRLRRPINYVMGDRRSGPSKFADAGS